MKIIDNRKNIYSLIKGAIYDIPIGEVFVIDNQKYIVELRYNFCVNCDCEFIKACEHLNCTSSSRKDWKYVAFKKIL